MFTDLKEDPFDQPSMMSNVKSSNNACTDNTKFFTVQVKISSRSASPKILKHGKVVRQ